MGTSIKLLVSASALAALLGGCYVIPVEQDGQVVYQGPYLLPPSGTQAVPGKAGPITLSARLYPNNDLAVSTGVVSGSVTNMMTGKGRFALNYKGEAYAGEATRVSDDDRRGVASAFSPSGGYMSCEYQMNTPRQGAGTCVFSDGAQYKLHIGG
ncbi:MAG: hypothetical protein KDI88_09270 [Gammaproteobacteria bacterium]|nr:hypothetical protein [Gammaproteobacteria bacterium]